MSQQFDPATFIDAVVTEANATVSTPVPVGEYLATAGEVKIESWVSKADPTKSGLRAEVPWVIENNDAVSQVTGRPKNTVRQSIMLDLTPEGGLDMGKGMNVQLGKLREAVGLNQPGQPFSFRMIQGRTGKVKVEHEPYNGALYAKVTGIAKAG